MSKPICLGMNDMRLARFMVIMWVYVKHRLDWAKRFAGTDMMWPERPSVWRLIRNQWSNARGI